MSYITIEQLGNMICEEHFNFRYDMEDLKRDKNYALALMISNELKSHTVKEIEEFESDRYKQNFFNLQTKCSLITLVLLEKNTFQSYFSKEVLYLYSKMNELKEIFGENKACDLITQTNTRKIQKKQDNSFFLSKVVTNLFIQSSKNEVSENIFIEFTNKFYSKELDNELFNFVKTIPLTLNHITLLNKTKFDFFNKNQNVLSSIIQNTEDFYGEKEIRKIKFNNLILCLKLGIDCPFDIQGRKNWRNETKTFLEMLLERDWGQSETIELLNLKTDWLITDKSDELIQSKEHSSQVKKAYEIIKEKQILDSSINKKITKASKKVKI